MRDLKAVSDPKMNADGSIPFRGFFTLCGRYDYYQVCRCNFWEVMFLPQEWKSNQAPHVHILSGKSNASISGCYNPSWWERTPIFRLFTSWPIKPTTRIHHHPESYYYLHYFFEQQFLYTCTIPSSTITFTRTTHTIIPQKKLYNLFNV